MENSHREFCARITFKNCQPFVYRSLAGESLRDSPPNFGTLDNPVGMCVWGNRFSLILGPLISMDPGPSIVVLTLRVRGCRADNFGSVCIMCSQNKTPQRDQPFRSPPLRSHLRFPAGSLAPTKPEDHGVQEPATTAKGQS